MSLSSYVASLDQSCLADLPFNRQLILFGVGQNVSMPKSGRGTDGQEIRPIDRSIRRRKRHGKALSFDKARGAVHKRRNKLWRCRAAIEDAERGIANFVEVRG